MEDLDSLLESAANETGLKREVNVDQELRTSNKMEGVKPWLAFSSNVPADTRDKWNLMVKVDALADTPQTNLQPSNSYYSWEPLPPLPGPNKLLQELIRSAAQNCGFDETKTAKLMQMANPVIETEAARQLQTAYKHQLVNDVKEAVKSDPNYSAAAFPDLAKAI